MSDLDRHVQMPRLRIFNRYYYVMLMTTNPDLVLYDGIGYGTNLLTKGGEVSENFPRTRDGGKFSLTSPSFVRKLFRL